MRFFGLILAAVILAATPGNAWSIDFFDQYGEIVNDPATRKIGGFVWDNDAFYFMGRATDMFYTNGFMMERKYVGQGYYYLDDPTDKFVRASGEQLASWQTTTDRPTLYRQSYGIHFGQNLYTPSDIELKFWELDPQDRPYAAWFYLGMYREVISESSAWLRYGLDVGVLGPSARGRETQRLVHQLPFLNAANPMGWQTQIRNEYGIQLFAETTPFVWSANKNLGWNYMDVLTLEVSPDLRLNAGNIFMNAQAGIHLRLGQVNPYFTRPRQNEGINPRIVRPPDTTPEPRSERYFFWNVTGQAVGYNGTIEGRHTALTPQVHERPFVYDTEAGVAHHGKKLFLSYSVVVRSSEVKELSSKFPQHRFGRFVITWEY